jgi:hypothetical protein
MKVNIIENRIDPIEEHMNDINQFRNEYNLSKDEYSDDLLYDALLSNDFNKEKAFSSIIL